MTWSTRSWFYRACMRSPDRRAEFKDALTGGAMEALAALAGVAVPGSGPALQLLAQKIRQERERSASTALTRAEQITGLTREELADEIARDPRLVPLAARLLHAAGMNGHDRTLQAMGAALGAAVNRRESLDECELILTALGDLTDSHAAVLAVMAQEVPGEPDAERRSRWSREELTEACGLGDRVVTICAAALVARGLARMPGAILGGGDHYQLTELGRLVLDVLNLYASE